MTKHIKIINPGIIQQIFPWVMCYGDKSKKNVFLTFDDGPDPEFTPKVLNILHEFQIPAFFFLRGDKVEQNPILVEKILINGCGVGNHGYSHKSLWGKSLSFLKREVERTNEVIKRIYGKEPIYFRPPFGRFDLRFKNLMSEFDMSLVLWSLLTYDFSSRDSNWIVETVNDNVKNGSIIVFHDALISGYKTVLILPQVIENLLAQGYDFSTFH